jgi:hypothetical protein
MSARAYVTLHMLGRRIARGAQASRSAKDTKKAARREGPREE